MSTMEDLKGLAESIKKDCTEKKETIELLKKFVDLFEQYLTSSGTLFPETKIRSYFFDECALEVVQTLSTLMTITKQEVI